MAGASGYRTCIFGMEMVQVYLRALQPNCFQTASSHGFNYAAIQGYAQGFSDTWAATNAPLYASLREVGNSPAWQGGEKSLLLQFWQRWKLLQSTKNFSIWKERRIEKQVHIMMQYNHQKLGQWPCKNAGNTQFYFSYSLKAREVGPFVLLFYAGMLHGS